jgi:hypothetical protein
MLNELVPVCVRERERVLAFSFVYNDNTPNVSVYNYSKITIALTACKMFNTVGLLCNKYGIMTGCFWFRFVQQV